MKTVRATQLKNTPPLTRKNVSDDNKKPPSAENRPPNSTENDQKNTVSTENAKTGENGETKILRLYFDEKGQIAWERMRAATKSDLKEIFSRPDVKQKLGIIEPETASAMMIKPEWCDSLYDGLGRIEIALLTKFKGIPPNIAEAVFAYSEKEKALLREPTARIINKYATEWMIKFQDEIALAYLLTTITLGKLQLVNVLLAQAKTGAPAPVTEIRPTGEVPN